MSTSGTATERIIAAICSYKGTLKRFSKESGIPYPSLMDYKSGKRNPGINALIAIVKTTEVSAEWLLLGVGDMQKNKSRIITIHIPEVPCMVSEEWVRDRLKLPSNDSGESQ